VDAKTLRVDVKDDGPGLSETQLESLFLDFTVKKHSAVRSHGGSGLGLAVAFRAMKCIGGTLIVADSAPGAGSTFRLEFPFTKAQSRAAVDPPVMPLQMPSDPAVVDSVVLRFDPSVRAPSDTLLVMIVDDSPINRRICQRFVESAGVRQGNITTACDGAEAVEKHQTKKADVIFMDLMMPVMDGFEAMKRIRELDPRVILITSSASCTPEDHRHSVECGSNGFMTKPYTAKDVENVLEKACSRLQAERTPGEQPLFLRRQKQCEALKL